MNPSGEASAPAPQRGSGPSAEEGRTESRRRKKRTIYSEQQKEYLFGIFQTNPKPDYEEMVGISAKLDISVDCVRTWFQNRRARKKKKEAAFCVEEPQAKGETGQDSTAPWSLPLPRCQDYPPTPQGMGIPWPMQQGALGTPCGPRQPVQEGRTPHSSYMLPSNPIPSFPNGEARSAAPLWHSTTQYRFPVAQADPSGGTADWTPDSSWSNPPNINPFLSSANAFALDPLNRGPVRPRQVPLGRREALSPTSRIPGRIHLLQTFKISTLPSDS